MSERTVLPLASLIQSSIMRVSRYCFTLNNFDNDDQARLRALGASVKYLVFGRETGTSGTPHLQGFVVFNTSTRFASAKRAIGQRAHLEAARGTNAQASDYCKKDGDFEEFGSLPAPQGTTNRFADFKQWVLEQPTKPSAALVAEEHPSIFLQYGRVMEWIDLIYPVIEEDPGEYRPYQQHLADLLSSDPDSRKIIFVVDPVGNTGKSWFVSKWFSENSDISQQLCVGKRDDIAHVVDESKRVFLFDIPRSQSEFLQYSILEKLKDRYVFSPKYNSRMKRLDHRPHVVVFMNEEPDRNKLSTDRYHVIRWNVI